MIKGKLVKLLEPPFNNYKECYILVNEEYHRIAELSEEKVKYVYEGDDESLRGNLYMSVLPLKGTYYEPLKRIRILSFKYGSQAMVAFVLNESEVWGLEKYGELSNYLEQFNEPNKAKVDYVLIKGTLVADIKV